MLIAILAALGAACSFATASVLEQRAARRAPEEESLKPSLIADLLRRPAWVGGVGASVAAFGLQALALGFGNLTLVQPLIVMEIIFGLPVAIRLRHKSMGPREWAGAVAVVGGVALFLVTAAPRGGHPDPSGLTWVVVGAAVAGATGGCLLMARGPESAKRATLLGITAGSLFGLMSALLKSSTYLLAHQGIVATLSTWQPYAMGAVAAGGFLCAQSAFQAGPLAASLPVIDTLEPGVAIAIAIAAFGQVVNHSLLALVLEALGVVAVVTGIFVLDRSPLILSLQEPPDDQRPGGDEAGPTWRGRPSRRTPGTGEGRGLLEVACHIRRTRCRRCFGGR
ncbi:MAG: DMT family transporter [Acidimicrobiales bacterium]